MIRNSNRNHRCSWKSCSRIVTKPHFNCIIPLKHGLGKSFRSSTNFSRFQNRFVIHIQSTHRHDAYTLEIVFAFISAFIGKSFCCYWRYGSSSLSLKEHKCTKLVNGSNVIKLNKSNSIYCIEITQLVQLDVVTSFYYDCDYCEHTQSWNVSIGLTYGCIFAYYLYDSSLFRYSLKVSLAEIRWLIMVTKWNKARASSIWCLYALHASTS